MADGRLVYHSSIKEAQANSLKEVKQAMVANPNAVQPPAESEEDHRAQWMAACRTLPVAVGNLFIALIQSHNEGRPTKAFEDARHAITKFVRGWGNRYHELGRIKGNVNSQIVALETRRNRAAQRMSELDVSPPTDPAAHAEELVYTNACKRLQEYRRRQIMLLAEANGLELSTYSGKTFGLGVACLRFFSVYRRDVARVKTDYDGMLSEIRNTADGKNRARALQCQALKNKFMDHVLKPTLTLLAARGRSPEEIRVAAAVYTDVADADPYCVQRCNLVEMVLSKFEDTPAPERDNQAVALERAQNTLLELRNTAAQLRNMTAEAIARDATSELRSIQAREAAVQESLSKAEAEVDRLASIATVTPAGPQESPAELLSRVREIKAACQSIRVAVEAASNLPHVIEGMITDQRQTQSKELFRAAVANIKAANDVVKAEFDAADKEIQRLRHAAKQTENDIAVVDKARSSYEPHTYTQEDVALFALREEIGRIEDSLHKLHVQRLGIMGLIAAAKWIVQEGSRLLSKTAMA